MTVVKAICSSGQQGHVHCAFRLSATIARILPESTTATISSAKLTLPSFLSIEYSGRCYLPAPAVGIPVGDLPPAQSFDDNVTVVRACFDANGNLLDKPGMALVKT